MAKRREHYGTASIEAHIRRHHPGCPQALRAEFVAIIEPRKWEKASLGLAFGIVATNYVRHRLTDYDRLKKIHGLTREEARIVVAQEVKDIMATWKMGPPPPPPL